jgi:hypothetical protein
MRNDLFLALTSMTLVATAACGGEGSLAAPGGDGGADTAAAIPGAPAAPPAATDTADGGATVPAPTATSCSIKTHTVMMFQGRLIETLTAHGQMYTFEANGTPWATNGLDLTSVGYYAAGPCAGRAAGQCELETRTYALFPNNRLIEFITAYGKYWSFENGTATASGADLSTIARYSKICELRNGGLCTFDTRAFVTLDGKLTETVTAYGKHFSFDESGKGWNDNGGDLTAVPRYASGPCKGAAAGACKFDTRTFGLANGQVVETITAGGNIYRYVAAGANAFTEVQPSNVPVTSVTAWAGGPCK